MAAGLLIEAGRLGGEVACVRVRCQAFGVSHTYTHDTQTAISTLASPHLKQSLPPLIHSQSVSNTPNLQAVVPHQRQPTHRTAAHSNATTEQPACIRARCQSCGHGLAYTTMTPRPHTHTTETCSLVVAQSEVYTAAAGAGMCVHRQARGIFR